MFHLVNPWGTGVLGRKLAEREGFEPPYTAGQKRTMLLNQIVMVIT
jgi:hypothetical protein